MEERPGFIRRCVAFVVDAALYALYATVAGLLLMALVFALAPELASPGNPMLQVVAIVVYVIPMVLYLWLTESGRHQATIGKRALDLQVVAAATGARVSRPRVLVRTVVKVLPWVLVSFGPWKAHTGSSGYFTSDMPLDYIAVSLLPLVYLGFVAFDRLHRGPHDLLAGTRVVRVHPAPGTEWAEAAAAELAADAPGSGSTRS